MTSVPPDSPAPRAAAQPGARALTIASFVLAALALFFLPVVLGPIALVLGILGYVRGDRPLAMYAIIASVVGLLGGVLLGALLLNASR